MQSDVDGVVVGKMGLGSVAEMGGGKAKVFGGTAQADKEFAVVGIYGGQAAGEIAMVGNCALMGRGWRLR